MFWVLGSASLCFCCPLSKACWCLPFLLSETQELANKAAGAVSVTYESLGTPILSIKDAIARESFFIDPDPLVTGEAAGVSCVVCGACGALLVLGSHLRSFPAGRGHCQFSVYCVGGGVLRYAVPFHHGDTGTA